MIDFDKIKDSVKQERAEITKRLVEFAQTDVLLFWSGNSEVHKLQEKQWLPVLKWLRKRFGMHVIQTEALTPPVSNVDSLKIFTDILNNLSLDNFSAFYLAAVRMKSPLLALALVERQVNADEAFNLAYLEEIWQSEKWGKDENAENRRCQIKQEINQIVSLSENK